MSKQDWEPEPGLLPKTPTICPECHEAKLHRIRRVGAKPIQVFMKCMQCFYERQVEPEYSEEWAQG